MCVLSDMVGDVSRPLVRGRGGGVRESARGLLWFEGDGEMAGDDASGGCRQVGVNADASSSDMALGSSSFSSDDTSGVSVSIRSRPFLKGNPFAGRTVDGPAAAGAGDGADADASPWVGSRRVRGRFSFRSCSAEQEAPPATQ